MLGIAWKHWHWLDDGLLPLSAAVTYAAWVYPTLTAYVSDPSLEVLHAGSAFWLCLGTLLGARVMGRLAGRFRRSGLIVVGGGLASVLAFSGWVLLGLPQTYTPTLADEPLRRMLVAGAACAVLLWWRGTRFAYDDHHEETARTFAIGAVALAMLVLVSHVYGPSQTALQSVYTNWLFVVLSVLTLGVILVSFAALGRVDGRKLVSWGEGILASFAVLLTATLPLLPSPETLGGPILLFVFAGLIARALVGLSWVLNTQRGRGGVRLHVDPGWLGIVFGTVVSITVLGLLIGQALAPQAILGVIAWLWRIVSPLVWVLGLFVSALLWLLMELVSFALSRWSIRLPEIQPPSVEELERAGDTALEWPILAKQGINLLWIVIVVALVTWVLYRAARRLQGAGALPTAVSEKRRRVLSLERLRKQLRRVVSRLRAGAASPFVLLGTGEGARRAVRRAYRDVLRRAMDLDAPRARNQTPGQYVETLSELCPQRKTDLDQLARTYETARYSPIPPTSEQVQAAGEASVRVDADMKAQRRARDLDREPPSRPNF